MKRALVIGDTILDEYVYGTIDRVNPEAPYCVVLDAVSSEFRLGGACNVACNIKSIQDSFTKDGIEVTFHGAKSSFIDGMLCDQGINPSHYICSHKEILTKTRFVNNNHQIMRLDRGKQYDIDRSSFNQIFRDLELFDVIVLSDYNKGTINPELVKKVLESGKMVFLDLKKRANLGFDKKTKRYKNLIIKCNRKEFEEEVKNSGLIEKCLAVIETRGKDPFCIHQYREEDILHTKPMDEDDLVVDVVGAGDTFLAGMIVEYLDQDSDFSLLNLASVGNHFSSIKVRYFGTKAIGVLN